MSTQLDRVEQMLRALCDHLGVHVVKSEQVQEADYGVAGNGRRYTGIVSRFALGWGFIECAALGRNFFVHHSDVEGTGLRSLQAGEEVSFEVGAGKDGRAKAIRVQRQSANTIAIVTAARMATTEYRPEASVLADSDHEVDDDMPQPASPGTPLLGSTHRRATGGRVALRTAAHRRPPTSW